VCVDVSGVVAQGAEGVKVVSEYVYVKVGEGVEKVQQAWRNRRG
jgi:hypothetical protein